MAERAAAVNVDIDALRLYYRIHGLAAPEAEDAVWDRGVPRFAELFDELGVRATFFVVGEDVADPSSRARRRAEELVRAGHELANHTWSHPYDLARQPRAEMAEELRRARQVLETVQGRPPAGFRAPGYTTSETLFELLADHAYGYDSSLLPSPPYHLAKASVMGWMRLRGRRSASVLDRPEAVVAPRGPHRLANGLLELPITVLPGLRVPLIGTSLALMGERGWAAIRPLVRRCDFVNLELHGIDLCALDDDGLDPALRRQPDLHVPVRRKRALFRRVVEELRDGWGVDTLERLTPRLRATT